MPMPIGLSRVAMSVPPGTLTDERRAELLELYGGLFGWRELESLRLPDRLTMSVGPHSYLDWLVGWGELYGKRVVAVSRVTGRYASSKPVRTFTTLRPITPRS